MLSTLPAKRPSRLAPTVQSGIDLRDLKCASGMRSDEQASETRSPDEQAKLGLADDDLIVVYMWLRAEGFQQKGKKACSSGVEASKKTKKSLRQWWP